MSRLTNANYARAIACILMAASRESAQLAGGMWNPLFCSAEADTSGIEEIKEWIARIEDAGAPDV